MILSATSSHPLIIGLSFLCAVIYDVFLKGKKALRSLICFILPMTAFVTAINVLFNHRGVSLKIPENSFTGILGENAGGKTTLLKILGGIYKPYRGRVEYGNSCKGENLAGYVPQDVKLMFTSKTVADEFSSVCGSKELIDFYINMFDLSRLLHRHPYDLSGGEMQKTAIVKALLLKPALLLLDEPTKGLDPKFKNELGNLLRELAKEKKTVVAVSHDIEFCAKHCDCCVMLSGGQAVKQRESREFFSDNIFYTTSANRISRGIFKNAVTDDEVTKLLEMNNIKPDKML